MNRSSYKGTVRKSTWAEFSSKFFYNRAKEHENSSLLDRHDKIRLSNISINLQLSKELIALESTRDWYLGKAN